VKNQILRKTVHSILQSGLTLHLTQAGGGELKLKGYKHKSLPERNWKILAEDNKIIALSEWAEWVFEGGKAEVHGFYVNDKVGDTLWKEKFKEGPYEILRKDDKLRIRPKMAFMEDS